MAITAVTAHALRVPVEQPTRIATRILDKRDYLIVTVTDNETAETGVGYAYAGTSGGRTLATIVSDILEPLLKGADADDIYFLWRKMQQETLLIGPGAAMRAISAVDMALWDLAAKKKSVPLAVLLGGSVKPIPAYASGGYYRSGERSATEQIVDEILFNQKHGFRDHKIKVGGAGVSADAERVHAAIDAIGGQGRLALDANNAYRTKEDALIAIRAFEKAAGDRGIWWFEEPLSPEDIEGHSHIARCTETAVATGEIHQTRWDFRRLLESRAADILQVDAGVCGGVSEWMTVARTADSFDMPVAPHWHANIHAHLAAATPNCIVIEHFILEKDIYNFEKLLTPETRFRHADGMVEVPARPGIGIELDPECFSRFGAKV